MKKQNFFRENTKQSFWLFLLIALHSLASGQQGDTGSFYIYKKDWTAAGNIQEAVYFMQSLKEDDSTYICRFYNRFDGMIYQESFLDSMFTIPNGRFCWYDKNGMIDSTGLAYRGRKNGDWIYYDDEAKPIHLIKYNNGVPVEKKDYSSTRNSGEIKNSAGLSSKIMTGRNSADTDSLIAKNAVFEDTDSGTLWKQYLKKNISVPERFSNIKVDGSYPVIVCYTVNGNGKTDDIYLIHSCEWSIDNEVFKAVKNGSVWNNTETRNGNAENIRKDTITFCSSVGMPGDSVKKTSVFVGTQIEAKFPGGTNAWARFLEKNLNSQVPADNNAPSGEYHVVISFVVDKDGIVGDLQAISDPGYGTAEEVIRVIKKSPKWSPAIQNGVPVIYRQKQAFMFSVSEVKPVYSFQNR